MLRSARVLLTALVSAFTLAAFMPADDFLQLVVDRLTAHTRHLPTEKVYVHTDRDVYLPAETIWMKGYVVNGINHEADTLSRVLYVDLIDARPQTTAARTTVARTIVARLQLKATGGYAPGQLTLPDSLPAGTYVLQAYTGYMRNYPADYYYRKAITVLPADEPARRAGAPGEPEGTPDVQFMPEGGYLVSGIESRVAFKVTDRRGYGLPVSGFVIDSRNDTLTGFESIHNGMGFFVLKPEAGQTYRAFARIGDGPLQPYPLPAALATGVSLQVDNVSSRQHVRVYIRHNRPTGTGMLTLLAQSRGRPEQSAQIPLSRSQSVLTLPRETLFEGITQLTLFDENRQPVCERLIYVDRGGRLRVSVQTDKRVYKPRERVGLTITTTDTAGRPVPANLSLAVVDGQQLPEPDSGAATLVSHLLLSADLTGFIEQPGYYFESTSPERWRHLDLLLMTQGWRRFVWADVLAGKLPPVVYPIEGGLSLTGRVQRSGQRETGGPVNLSFFVSHRDSTRDFMTGQTDATGAFGAYNLDFTDTTMVLIQAIKGKYNRDLTVSLDQLLTPTVRLLRVPYNPVDISRAELAELRRRMGEYLAIERQIRQNREVLLKSVTVKAKRADPLASRRIYGAPDASVVFDDRNTAGRISILDVIQGRVAGVQVTGSGFNARVQIRGAVNFGGAIEPLFVLDGMPVDLQTINSISVQDVDRVDVLKGASAAIYGSQGAGGVIAVLTKRGSSGEVVRGPAPGTLVAKLPGYAPVREFYAPRYEQSAASPERPSQDRPGQERPDYRATLHWAPLIQTGTDGRATVTFWTSDARTRLRLRAEGATTGGLPGSVGAQVRVE